MCPSTEAHYSITEKFLGKKYENVHKLIDGSVSIPRTKLVEMGLGDLVDKSSHRKDAVHTTDFWLLLYAMGKVSFDELLAALLHFECDKIDTATKHGVDHLVNPRFEINRLKAKILKGKDYTK
jgi:hypothetical protein